jgi:predicted nucleotidyltransferase
VSEDLDRLRRFDWGRFGVVFSIVFGSRVRGRGFRRDWDVAVWVEGLERVVDLQYALARYLGVPEDYVDVVVLNNYELLPCTLIVEILGRGRLVYCRDLESFLDTKLRVLLPCFDFQIDSRKLKLLEAQVESVTRGWGY